MGSGASILWPPARQILALAHTSLAPSITIAATSGASVSTGHPKIAIAIKGWPPIA